MTFCLRDTAGSPERARWLHLARSGSQSQRAIWFILPTRGASHYSTTQHNTTPNTIQYTTLYNMLSWKSKIAWVEDCSKNRKIRARVDSRKYGGWKLQPGDIQDKVHDTGRLRSIIRYISRSQTSTYCKWSVTFFIWKKVDVCTWLLHNWQRRQPFHTSSIECDSQKEGYHNLFIIS